MSISMSRRLRMTVTLSRPQTSGLDGKDPKFQVNDGWRPAATAALILSRTGDRQAAERLAKATLAFLADRPRMGLGGKTITDARLLATLGKKAEAIATLRQAVDEGWRSYWWYHLEHDPALEALHEEPEFIAIRQAIEADMAEQLTRLRQDLDIADP